MPTRASDGAGATLSSFVRVRSPGIMGGEGGFGVHTSSIFSPVRKLPREWYPFNEYVYLASDRGPQSIPHLDRGGNTVDLPNRVSSVMGPAGDRITW